MRMHDHYFFDSTMFEELKKGESRFKLNGSCSPELRSFYEKLKENPIIFDGAIFSVCFYWMSC